MPPKKRNAKGKFCDECQIVHNMSKFHMAADLQLYEPEAAHHWRDEAFVKSFTYEDILAFWHMMQDRYNQEAYPPRQPSPPKPPSPVAPESGRSTPDIPEVIQLVRPNYRPAPPHFILP